MLCTGYFAKTNSYVEAGMIPISIAARTPGFFKYKRWPQFAPDNSLLWKWKSGAISDKEYTEIYLDYLDKNIPEHALKNIKKLAENKDIVLCCYEKPNDFCHRHLLAEWLSKKLGLLITEVTVVPWKFPKGD